MLNTYYLIYGTTVLTYLWYRYIFRFIWELKKKQYGFTLRNYPYSVIIPVYNEKPELLKKCIESVINSKGTKEIIVIDDGSTNNCTEILEPYKNQIKIIHQKNKGKRYAQKKGIEIAKYSYIITIDSDSIVYPYSILRLLQPFENPKIGATTGKAHAINRNENWLTKMIDARYKNAFGFERASLSALGIVTCCSGVLSAYRKKIIKPLMDKYVHQKFLNEECTYGDDRHLTNLVLMNNYKIQYVDEAIVLTEVPNKLTKFIKQQIRWKKSFIRESIIALTFCWKKSFWLTLEIIWNLIIPYLAVIARITAIILIFIYPLEILSFILAVCTIAIIRNLLLLFEDKKAFTYSVAYSFIHEFIIYWLYFYAPLKLKDKKWGTR